MVAQTENFGGPSQAFADGKAEGLALALTGLIRDDASQRAYYAVYDAAYPALMAGKSAGDVLEIARSAARFATLQATSYTA